MSDDIPAITSVTYLISTRIRSCNIFTADLCVCRCDSTLRHQTINPAPQIAPDSQLVPLPPPRAVQSTAMRSASPVSTLYGTSMYTERDFRSRSSIVGSYALNGSVCAFTSELEAETSARLGCRMRRRGVEQYTVNLSGNA